MTRLLSVVAAVLTLTSCASTEVRNTNEAYWTAVDQAMAAGAPLLITRVSTSRPNTAGGVDLDVRATNTTNKAIKYIYYDAQAFNAVGDPVRGTITNRSIAEAEVTGPIGSRAMHGMGKIWKNLWYNHSIVCARLTEAKIIYMDGSSKTLRGQSLQNVLAPGASRQCS